MGIFSGGLPQWPQITPVTSMSGLHAMDHNLAIPGLVNTITFLLHSSKRGPEACSAVL